MCKAADGGRHFALDHPMTSESWTTRLISIVKRMLGVYVVDFYFCMLGMVAEDELGVEPARKPTRVITSSAQIFRALSEYRCDGTHHHVHLMHGRASAAQVYPEMFCLLMCRAFARQVDQDRLQAQGRPVPALASTAPVSWAPRWPIRGRRRSSCSRSTRSCVPGGMLYERW